MSVLQFDKTSLISATVLSLSVHDEDLEHQGGAPGYLLPLALVPVAQLGRHRHPQLVLHAAAQHALVEASGQTCKLCLTMYDNTYLEEEAPSSYTTSSNSAYMSASNEPPRPRHELQRLARRVARVELLAAEEGAGVVDRDEVPRHHAAAALRAANQRCGCGHVTSLRQSQLTWSPAAPA